MNPRRLLMAAVPAVLLLAVPAGTAAASPATVTVCGTCAVRSPQEGLSRLAPGGTLLVQAGRYPGGLVVHRPARLVGVGDPVLDGGQTGTVVRLAAPDSSIEGFTVRGSGSDLDREDTGILVEAPRATVRANRVEDTLFGIYVKGADGTVVAGNTVSGKPLPVAEKGDGIRVWYSHGATIDNNTVRGVRDNLVQFSSGCRISRNHLVDDRYGLHFMFSDNCRISDNVAERNSVGGYFMYSVGLAFVHNTFRDNRGPSGDGIAIRDCDAVTGTGNQLVHNRVGLSLFNTPRDATMVNHFRGNLLAYNDVGLSVESAVRGDVIAGNDFVDNLQQVGDDGEGALTGITWTENGRGNYWSDYGGYDGHGDGVGDVPYAPGTAFESLAAGDPDLKLLLLSPAAKALDWAAAAFPVFGGQVPFHDPAPLVRPARTAAAPARSGIRPPLLAGSLVLMLAGLAMVFWVVSGAGTRRSGTSRATDPAGACAAAPTGGTVAGADREGAVRSAAAGTRRPVAPGLTAGAAGTSGPAVAVTGLRKAYGDTVIIDGLSFEVGAGEAVALWGDNGAGKTTVLRCLLGLVRCDGEVRVGGWDRDRHRRRALAEMGHVCQEPAFHGDLTVAATLGFYGRLRGAGQADQAVALDTVGLRAAAGKRVSDLSGGMRRKLAVAVALLGRPRVLLLDEPTANLDRRSRHDLVTLLRELKAAGIAMILATHQPDEVIALADRVLRLEPGKPAREVDVARFGDDGTGRLALLVPQTRREQAARLLLDAGIPAAEAEMELTT